MEKQLLQIVSSHVTPNHFDELRNFWNFDANFYDTGQKMFDALIEMFPEFKHLVSCSTNLPRSGLLERISEDSEMLEEIRSECSLDVSWVTSLLNKHYMLSLNLLPIWQHDDFDDESRGVLSHYLIRMVLLSFLNSQISSSCIKEITTAVSKIEHRDEQMEFGELQTDIKNTVTPKTLDQIVENIILLKLYCISLYPEFKIIIQAVESSSTNGGEDVSTTMMGLLESLM